MASAKKSVVPPASCAIEESVTSELSPRRPQLAVFLPSLNGGGAERAILTLANSMALNGIDVDLVLASAAGPYRQDVNGAIRIVDLKSKRVIFSVPGLVSYLRSSRPEVFLSAMNYANVAAVLAHAMSTVEARMVVSERTNFSAAAKQWPLFKRFAMVALMRWAYRRADAVVAVSKGVADDLSQCLRIERELIDVIYNPIGAEGVAGKASEPVNHPWLSERQLPVIVAVGRLTSAKDYPTLLRAIQLVKRKIDCRVVILGDGELLQGLEALASSLQIRESVHFAGFVTNPFAWMARADLFVLSSAWEGLPNVLIQAMACGTPVVSTDCPSGPREILEDGRWGRLVAVGDASSLADAIVEQLSTPVCRKEDLIRRAEYFSVDSALQKYSKVFGMRGGN